MCFWLCLNFACECKESVRDDVYGCGHLMGLEIHLLHASHLQVTMDVCGRVYFSWMCMMFVNNNKSNFVFLPNCVCMFSGAAWLFQQVCGEHEWIWMFLRRVWRVFGNGWWIRTCRIHPTVWNVWDGNGREFVFAPRPFQDGTAKRRRHSTVHVHDR